MTRYLTSIDLVALSTVVGGYKARVVRLHNAIVDGIMADACAQITKASHAAKDPKLARSLALQSDLCWDNHRARVEGQ